MTESIEIEKMTSNSRVDDLIKEYFKSERTYMLILQRLKEVHGVKRSLIWLKLRLKYLGLKRRGGYASDDTVRSAIARELRSSPQLFGYRAMWRHISIKYKLHVKR
ncbi:PREDICTED: uncharacterized protein LOC109586196 [Amphimedon queenslandica]|uniref:Uncharacterized protein n=1 Tax=Amphimedon queenslandica TaxID=400682 RepID=A0A1X7TT02_AMPQE|nr:PREDICTED: uncharacterized protein LOC109586196 [Amphimedon queenslandica]|eukprot:XP_019857926.1 PREDICTED: uncharacterized protein LOC109586196 [Amphimedon queenslandica]